MACKHCGGQTIGWSRDRRGNPRRRCKECGRTHTEVPPSPLAPMRLPVDRAILVLNLLVEGSSIRAAERITGHHRDTICRLLVLVGGRCERFLAELVQAVPVHDVQADEIWGFVGMKERTKAGRRIEDDHLGDAYTFVGIERDTKLVLAWHLGRRTAPHTDAFVEKLDQATAGRFQLSTDGFAAYPEAVSFHLGTRTDYATVVKQFGYELEEQRRYSPPRIIATERTVIHGKPDPHRICTSHVECQNLTMRMQVRRLTRLTNAFSRKWENLRAALGLHFAWYNLVRFHRSLRMTPAMAADVVTRPWSMLDLVTATAV